MRCLMESGSNPTPIPPPQHRTHYCWYQGKGWSRLVIAHKAVDNVAVNHGHLHILTENLTAHTESPLLRHLCCLLNWVHLQYCFQRHLLWPWCFVVRTHVAVQQVLGPALLVAQSWDKAALGKFQEVE